MGCIVIVSGHGLSQCPYRGSVWCCVVCWLDSESRAEISATGYHCGSVKGVCSWSKFSPSPEPVGRSCSEPGSDCRAPGYPCSGRGNACDYLLCKPPNWRRKKRGGGSGRERQFDRDCVCVSAGRRDYVLVCVCVCECVRCNCVFIGCFGRKTSCGTHGGRVGTASV